MNMDRIKIRDKFAETVLPEGRPVIAWLSRGDVDPCWDRFLQETPLGQFQQSAMWARVKAVEGWTPLRLTITLDQRVVAGFQILWRSSWHVRIGYVSKGPVVLPGFPGLAEFTTDLLRRLTWTEKLRAIIVQPPDFCKQLPETLVAQSFQLNLVQSVNSCTWVIDATKGFTEVEQEISNVPTTSANTGCSALVRCVASLNRSSRSVCSILGASSLVDPSGILATMSKRSVDIQSGPVIW